MPTLQKIVVQDFRNIALQEVSFSPNVNCICGGNGEGKTNLLDAVWYLSMTKSALAPSDRFLFRHGCEAFALSGTYLLQDDAPPVRISVQVERGGEKKLRRDEKPYERMSAHIGLIPVVMVSPADAAMVVESGEERRRFVNAVLSQMDPAYLAGAQQYGRLLTQRNRLLKENEADEGLLDVLDERLSALALPLSAAREKFVSDLLPLVQKHYEAISGGAEQVSIRYRSDLQRGPLLDQLREGRVRDRLLRFTGAGLQRDDFLFEMEDHSIRRCGSQGQQKSFLVALKFAQYELMRRSSGVAPILLLDDLFDKLDLKRVENLLSMVSGTDFGQIFLTDTDPARLRGTVDALTRDRAYFKAEGGAFRSDD